MGTDYRKLAMERQEMLESYQRTLMLLLKEMGGSAEISFHTALVFRPDAVLRTQAHPSPEIAMRLWLEDPETPEPPGEKLRVTLMQSGRANGKLSKMQELVREEIIAGGHPHVATPLGMRCASPEVCDTPHWDGTTMMVGTGDRVPPV